jgi:cytochrome bd-type quinol oxidase subunit 2
VDAADRSVEPNERIVAAVALLVAGGAMAIDHLLGTSEGDDEGALADPAMFAIAIVLSIATAVLLFAWFVPRERGRGPERAARSGLLCSVLSIVPGFPFVIAGAGVALGLEGRGSRRRLEARAAVVVGSLLLVFGALGYLVAAVR